MLSYLVCRKKAGLTQSDVAKKLGITEASVSQWETGSTHPSTKRLFEIAQLYGCTVDELLTPDDTRQY